MNKHNLMRKIASVATELDYVGLTKEAKTMDLMLLKLAQSAVAAPGSDDDGNDVPDKYNPEFKCQADDDKAFSPEKWSKIQIIENFTKFKKVPEKCFKTKDS